VTGEKLVLFEGHRGRVWQAMWNRDESRILTASEDGTARQYYTRMVDLIRVACQRVPRNLRWDEWRDFMRNKRYRRTCANRPVHPSAGPFKQTYQNRHEAHQ
jgi:hypothetical protein